MSNTDHVCGGCIDDIDIKSTSALDSEPKIVSLGIVGVINGIRFNDLPAIDGVDLIDGR